MQHKYHIARRRGFSNGLPWKKDKASFRCKLGASLKSFSRVLCSRRRGSSHLVINGSVINSHSVSTGFKYWYFSKRLQQKIYSETSSTYKELIKRSFRGTLRVIMNEERGFPTKCNRWRIPQNRSRSFMSYLEGRMPISQVSNQGGAL